MAEFESEVGGVALAFAEINSKATAFANLQKLQVAQNNIAAAKGSITLEETAQRNAISRSLAQWQGSQAAGRAFRGTGAAGGGLSFDNAAAAQAADQAAIVESNAAAKEMAAIANNQVIFDDPVLAAIQGGIQGLEIGSQIAQTLIQAGEVHQNILQTPWGTFIENFLEVPGFDLGDLFDIP